MTGVIFAILVSIGIPVGFLIYAVIQKRIWPFILGLFAFIGSQVFFRIPILQLLETNSVTYTMFRAIYPILFSIVIALSAGIVEEGARFILMRYVLRDHSWKVGLIFGAGHGGVEAVLFVGISAVVAIIYPTDALMLTNDFAIGGIERLFAILLHIGLSLLVLRSVIERRYIFLILAILVHGFVNSLVGVIPLYMSPQSSLWVIEIVLAIVACSLFTYNLFTKRKGVFN